MSSTTLTRRFFCLLVVAFVFWLTLAVRSAGADPAPPDGDMALPPPAPTSTASVPVDSVATLELAAVKRRLLLEHRRLLLARRRVHTLTRTLAHRSSTREAIQLACSVYGNCDTLWRTATCESHLSPTAKNPSGASGLFQFLPGTFSSTPFGGFSIWSVYAQSLAAGWMMANHRGGEWVCR